MGQLLEYYRALTATDISNSAPWLMAEASFWGTEAEVASSVISRQGGKFCRISVKGENSLGDLCGELFVTLMAGKPYQGDIAVGRASEDIVTVRESCGGILVAGGSHGGILAAGDYWRTFTALEIHQFSKDTGDQNPLHLTARPIVQGLLLLDAFRDSFNLCDRTIRLRFHSPVYAKDPVSVSWGQGRWVGHCGERMCFHVETATLNKA